MRHRWDTDIEGVEVSHPVSATIGSLMQTVWIVGVGAKPAGVSAVEAMQPVAAEEAEKGGKVEGAGSEEEDLPPVHHKAWEVGRLRALNGVLSAELQPEELLLEAVKAPWKEASDEESSDEEVEVGSPLYPGELAPKRMRDETRGQDGRSKQQQKRGSRRQVGRGWRGEARR